MIRHRVDAKSTSARQKKLVDADVQMSARARDKGKGRAVGRWTPEEGWVRERFKVFGEHCARNQIRTLLIDCLVMTNLFYPSLAIYLSKRYPPPSSDSPFAQPRAGPSRAVAREHPLSVLTTRLLDSFFPYPPPLLPRLAWTGWWDDDPLDQEDGAWLLDRPEGETDWLDDEIRVMRVAWTDVGDVLDGPNGEVFWTSRDRSILEELREMTEPWEDYGHCLETNGTCLIFSPNDTAESGIRPIHMPNRKRSRSEDIYRGVVIPFLVGKGDLLDFEQRWAVQMAVVSGRLGGEVFEEARATGRSSDNSGAWMLTVSQSSAYLTLVPIRDLASATCITPCRTNVVGIPVEIGLHPLPRLVQYTRSPIIQRVESTLSLRSRILRLRSIMLLVGHVLFHSGSAWVEWLGGLNGADNPSNLHPPFRHHRCWRREHVYLVPARIGLALGKVGTSITIGSVSDLILLGLVWFVVEIRAVREFCVFAAVLIITDWFMLHTFFLTLADVLASSDGTTSPPSAEVEKPEPRPGWKKIIQARTAKSGSLIAILCCVGIIYYLTERHRLPTTAATLYGYDPSSTAQLSLRPSPTPPPLVSTNITSAQAFWRAINPDGWPSIRIYLPPASILVLPRIGHAMAPSALRALAGNRPRSPYPRIKPLLHAIKVLILPQAVTALALYGILLFLLKDKELLDAQRNKLGRGESSESVSSVNALSESVKVQMLPCSPTSDVEIIVSEPSGRMVLTISVDDSVHLWRFTDEAGGTRERIDVQESGHLVAGAVSVGGRWIAVATKHEVRIWEVVETAAAKLAETRSCQGQILRIAFQAPLDPGDPFVMSRQASLDGIPPILAISNAAVIILDDSGEQMVISGRSQFMSDSSDVITETHRGVEIWQGSSSGWDSVLLHSTNESARITSSRSFRLNRAMYSTVYAVGFSSGLVEVFDDSGTLLIAIHHAEPISSVLISAPRSSTCMACRSDLAAGFYLIAASPSRTHVDHVHPRSASGICACPTPSRRSASGDSTTSVRTASPSASRPMIIPPSPVRRSSPGHSPRRSPSLLAPVSNGEFPLSSHGTRRYSALHREDVAETASVDAGSWSDLESISLGAISTAGGGVVAAGPNRLLALHRAGTGINDESWLILALDLSQPWNGRSLVVDSARLAEAERRTSAERTMGETSIRARRNERLLSMSGRVAVLSHSAGSGSGGLAYVEVRSVQGMGTAGLLAGFGNRLGWVTMADSTRVAGANLPSEKRTGRNDIRTPQSTEGSAKPPFLAPPPTSFSGGSDQGKTKSL